MSMISKFISFVEKLNSLLGYAAGLGILLMGLILFYEVVMRYFLNSPTIWAQEVSIYIFMWTMLAGAAYTLHVDKHVRIDLLLMKLSPRTQKIMEFLTSIVGMVFSAFVTYQAYGMIAASFRYGKLSATPLRVPLWIPQTSMLIGFALLTLEFLFITNRKYSEISGNKETGGVA